MSHPSPPPPSPPRYGGQYPGLFPATSVYRLMRPTINLASGTVEYIGSLEQIYLNIGSCPKDFDEGVRAGCQ